MGFDTPAGTRGARLPSGPLFRWLNKVMAGRLRRKGGKMMGFNALVLTTVGAKSGAERTNPVGWFPGRRAAGLSSPQQPEQPGSQRGICLTNCYPIACRRVRTASPKKTFPSRHTFSISTSSSW